MDHSIDMGPNTWADWIAHFGGRATEATKLAALRNYIEQEARRALVNSGGVISAAWLDKKAPRVGIAARFTTESAYGIEVPVSGAYRTTVYASSRAEALEVFGRQLEATALRVVKSADNWTLVPPSFISGPEDTDPVLPDDAPATVDATLAALRETVLLAVISGPKVCVPGANEFLDAFGLARVPERKRFTVVRPVEGVASTTVEAFDYETASRVADWRWENGRNAWNVERPDLASAGDFTVTEV